MSYSRDQVKQITDKVLNMCKADAVEVRFSGGERSATRFANSSITANLIEHDQEVSVTVFYGQKTASATTHQFDDASLKRMIEQVQELAKRKPDNPELMPPVKPPQNYVEIDAVLPATENFGPAERAAMVKASTDICEKKGVLGAGLHPEAALDRRDRQLGGAVRLLPLRRGELHPDVPHARSDRLGMGGHDRREGRPEYQRRPAHRGGGRQGPQVAKAARRSSQATTR